jgi:hypothetical protein
MLTVSQNIGFFGGVSGREYSHVFSSGTTSNLSSYSYSNVAIGDPHPDRCLILHFEGGIFPSGTLDQVCTVNGVPAALIHSDLPNGFWISSSYSLYAIRDVIFVSEPIPEGSTANVIFSNGLTNDVMGVNIVKCIGPRPAIASSIQTTSMTRRINPKGLATIKYRTKNSGESITNASKRFRLLAANWHHSVGEYINTSGSEQDVTFTSLSGSEFELRVFT